jgi:hypothetical protein
VDVRAFPSGNVITKARYLVISLGSKSLSSAGETMARRRGQTRKAYLALAAAFFAGTRRVRMTGETFGVRRLYARGASIVRKTPDHSEKAGNAPGPCRSD